MFAEDSDRVTLLPLLNFFLFAITLRVTHRMTTEAIGIYLKEIRIAVLAYVGDSFLCGFVDLHHIHPAYARVFHFIAFRFLADFLYGRSTLYRCTHAIDIILTDPQYTQAPDLCQIQCFMK